jgi:hypothetical protein
LVYFPFLPFQEHQDPRDTIAPGYVHAEAGKGWSHESDDLFAAA